MVWHAFYAYELYYQPVVDVSQQCVIGVEILLRVKNSRGEFVSPFSMECGRRFISRLESDNVFFEAFLHHFERSIKRAQDTMGCVFLNVSIGNVVDGTLFKWLNRCAIKADLLCIELVERRQLEWEGDDFLCRLKDELENIKTVGCKLALDDFNPIHDEKLLSFLEIKGFIDFVKVEHDCYVKLRSKSCFVDFSLEPGCEVILEQVEHFEQIQKLKSNNFGKLNLFQGFCFSEAMEYKHCMEWLSNAKNFIYK